MNIKASVEVGDWIEINNFKWWKVIYTSFGSVWAEPGSIVDREAVTAHRPKSGPFKTGDEVRDIAGSVWILKSPCASGVTLVKPVEAIEAEGDHIVDAGNMAEPDKPRLTPIAGPPDLEGVPDDALFVVRYGGDTYTQVWCTNTMKSNVRNGWEIEWHIPLGVIEKPTVTKHERVVTIKDLPTCRGGKWADRGFYSLAVEELQGIELKENTIDWFRSAEPPDILADIKQLAANLSVEDFADVVELRKS